MPFTIRDEATIRADLLRSYLANQDAVTDLNVGSVLRTMFEESLSPEIAEAYFQLVELWDSFAVSRATGADLDARVADFGLLRDPAQAATGYALLFGPKVTNGTVTASGAATLDDGLKGWTPNEHVGRTVRIISGRGSGQRREVTANTATQLTVNPVWSTVPDLTSVYEVYKAPTSAVPIPLATQFYALDGDRNRVLFQTRRTPGVEAAGTATGGAASFLDDAGAALVPDAHVGDTIVLTGGTGVGQALPILDNTATRVTVAGTFAPAPDATTLYQIVRSTFPANADFVVVPIEAVEPGRASNVAAGTVRYLQAALAGVGGVTTTTIYGVEAALYNGRDEESDIALRGRFRLFLQSLTRGTEDALRYGALSYTDDDGNRQVHSAYVDDSTPGTVTLYIEDGSGTASGSLVAAVQDVIDGDPLRNMPGWRAAGIPVTVVSGAAVSVNVIVALTLLDGFSLADVRSQVSENIRDYFANLGLGEDVVYHRLISACYVDGVLDVAFSTPVANVVILATQKAVLGTLTVA